MKKPLALIAAALTIMLPLTSSAVTSQYPCDNVIFKGQSTDHTRELLICRSKGKISYTYGRISSQNGLDFAVSPSKVKWSSYSGTPWSEDGDDSVITINRATITVDNGKFVYAVSYGNDQFDDYIDEINVYSQGRKTANIKLDRETVTNRISKGLSAYGIKEVPDNLN